MSTLQNQLALTEREETARAVRLLLRRPLLTRGGAPEEYELVRRRQVAVTKWFENFLGWTLEVQPRAGHARLSKVPPPCTEAASGRPALRRGSGVPFDRLRYMLTCVVAAELVRRRVVVLSELADATVHACAADPALAPFETGRHAHRKAFVDALLLLEDVGALIGVEGRTESFVDDEDAPVLYRVEPAALFSLVAAPVGASQIDVDTGADGWLDDVLDRLVEEPAYGPGYRRRSRPGGELDDRVDGPTVNQRNLWLRHSALRIVFDDPVAYRERLSPAQRDYLNSISGREQLRKAAELAGFELEARAEGYLLVDAERIATDELFPADGAPSVAGLHLLTTLLAAPDASCPADRLRVAVGDLLAANPGWARTYQDDDGPARLFHEALALLGRHGLVEQGEPVVALPAAHRYRAAALEPDRRRARRAKAKTGAGPAAEQGSLALVAPVDVGPGGER